MSRPLLFFLMLLCSMGYSERSGEVKATVLGIAQDGGVPHAGCDQDVCLTQRHYVTSLVVKSADALYLFDATPDLREQHSEWKKRSGGATSAGRNLFDGIFLTHAHMGHYTGLIFLGKESVSTKKIPLYCSTEMAAYLATNEPWAVLIRNENIAPRPFKSGEEIRLGSLAVTPLAVPHRREFTDTYGFLIRGPSRSLLYIPDIDAWESAGEPLVDWLKRSDFALLDGTFYSGDELPGRDIRLVPHPLVQHSIQFFDRIPNLNCQIYFTHLNHTNPLLLPDSEASKELNATRYKVADEWQVFDL